MPDFELICEKNQVKAMITPYGELVVAPVSYSTAYYKSVATANTPYEVVPAISGKRFVITALLLASDKAFGSATVAETLTLYEAYPHDLDTIVNTVTKVDLLKNDRMPATGLNLITTNTVSIVAIATDFAADVTVAGYYVPV